ncbi:hypothetical protein M422DRAFT_264435 [Sphaerobolus stellatus SS14]|uniref:Myb-like domain-containing protein n=1 Tax=Sphaerobolus stellatus (strain SS14) TaxID=990650 RepID=A0A0C9V7V9_SPHS4|nr:hypothetical protein M422DRAFT_264435 [Sphaerobolus stellatus SS14]
MPLTRNQARAQQGSARQTSPTWECENGTLPDNDSRPSSPSPTDDVSHESGSDSERSEAFAGSEVENSKIRNAKSPNWLPWQDRFLVREVFKHRPFLKSRPEVVSMWNFVARKLKEDSKHDGSVIDRTGPACRRRFKRLIHAHRKSETRSLQKTGTNEEVNSHIETLTDLMALIEGYDAAKKEFLDISMEQCDLQTKASYEMRDAAMTGQVDRSTLIDVMQLEGATVRERQGQRKRKSASLADSNKENSSVHPSKRTHHETALKKVLNQHQENDQKQLEEACEKDCHCHEELLTKLDCMAGSIDRLTNTLQSQAEREAERNAQQTEMMKMITTVLQTRN